MTGSLRTIAGTHSLLPQSKKFAADSSWRQEPSSWRTHAEQKPRYEPGAKGDKEAETARREAKVGAGTVDTVAGYALLLF